MINFIKNTLLIFKKSLIKTFIVFGIINTIFGYFIGIINYHIFYIYVGAIGLGIINNIVTITFSFTTLKLFVFKTKNTNWIAEYFRSFIVYFFKGVIGIIILWVCLELIKLNIYFSQAISMISTAIFTYKGHKDFTFKV